MRTNVRRGLAAVIIVTLAGTALVACQNGRVGARCRTTDFGQNATHVLVCKNGRWQRSITKEQAAAFILAVIKARQAAAVAVTAAAAATPATPPPAPLVVTQLAAGFRHTCALRSDGTVWCWGDNTTGQLGDATTTQALTPVRVVGITTATQITTGFRHSCALLADNNVRCWGDNSQAQLGTGAITAPRLTPVQTVNITTATQLGTGWDHTCAVLADGTIRCWGSNSSRELGVFTFAGLIPTPVQTQGITTATQITGGNQHTCALLADRTVRCWGSNYRGRLGAVTSNNALFGTPNISTATQVTAGTRHACALLADRTVRCWGDNEQGQMGDGSPTDLAGRPTPVQTLGISTATQLAAGDQHTCAVLADRTVLCWGRNDAGALGNGDAVTPRSTPVQTQGITSAVQLAAGSGHTCALLADRTVRCWGFNNLGQLGDGTATNRLTPVTVALPF